MAVAADLVQRGAARFGSRVAVICEDQSLSFTDVAKAANRFAWTLGAFGATKGKRVALLAGNGLWSLSLDFACLGAGVVRVPLNPRLSLAEHRQMIEATDPCLVVHTPDLTDRAAELVASLPGLRTVGLGGPGAEGGPDLLSEAEQAKADPPGADVRPDDPMLFLFTSGTTGTLKAVVHTQASWAAIAANVLANLVSPGREARMLHAAPLIHASGTFVLPYWIRGAAAVVARGFEPQSYLASIERHRVTEVNLVPTMLAMLLAAAESTSFDLSSLRCVIYGASPMPRPVLAEAMERFGPIFCQYYGQSEAPLCITVLDASDHADPELHASCGHPAVDAQVRVADQDGVPVAPGELGEVQLRAAFQMAGYHDAPELTAQTISPDGWIRTRDLARQDPRGYLYLVDRSSDMIVTGGYNVYPREVEDALFGHPAVAECAVVGAPDPTWVEAVVAFVVLKPAATAKEEELKDLVRAQLAGYKVPKRVVFVESIPKSPVGKVLRRQLRKPLWAPQ